MFVPGSGYFKHRARITSEAASNDAILDIDIESASDKQRSAHFTREDELYDSDPNTDDFDVIDGFVSYTKHFKYLGTIISYSLRDDSDINERIAGAGKAMGAE